MSAEDLTTWPGVSVQQDLALVSLLGLTHVERNAPSFHRRHVGFAPEGEQQALRRGAIRPLRQAGRQAARGLQASRAASSTLGSLGCAGCRRRRRLARCGRCDRSRDRLKPTTPRSDMTDRHCPAASTASRPSRISLTTPSARWSPISPGRRATSSCSASAARWVRRSRAWPSAPRRQARDRASRASASPACARRSIRQASSRSPPTCSTARALETLPRPPTSCSWPAASSAPPATCRSPGR